MPPALADGLQIPAELLVQRHAAQAGACGDIALAQRLHFHFEGAAGVLGHQVLGEVGRALAPLDYGVRVPMSGQCTRRISYFVHPS